MLKKGIHAVTCGLLMSLICIVVLAAGAGPSAIPVWSWVCGSGHAAIAAEVAGSYAIYTNGDTVTAVDVRTGVPAFQGSDAQAVIQSAVDALPEEGGQITIGRGTYVLERPLRIKTRNGITLAGEGWQSTTLQAAGDNDILVMDGAWFCQITDLYFDGAAQPVDGSYGRGLYFGQTDPEGNQLNIFNNLFFSDCRVAIADDFNGQDTSCDNLFTNIKVFNSRYCDIRLWVTNEGYWNFEYIEVDHIEVDNDPAQPAVTFKGFHGVGLEEFGMLGWASDGLVFQECAFVSIAASDFDHGLGSGIVMRDCEWIKITDIRVASTCMGSPAPTGAAGLNVIRCSYLNFNNILVGSTEASGCSAIALVESDYGNLTNIISTYNAGNAIYLLDSDHINLSNSCVNENAGWGVKEDGESCRNIISCVQAQGGKGGISWCGESTAVRDSWSNDEWIEGPSGDWGPARSGSGVPGWAWALIGTGSVVVLGAGPAACFLARRQSRFR